MTSDDDRTWLDAVHDAAIALSRVGVRNPRIHLGVLDRERVEALRDRFGGPYTLQLYRGDTMIVGWDAVILGIPVAAQWSYPLDLSWLAQVGESGATNAPAVVPATDARADFEAATRAMLEATMRAMRGVREDR